MRSLMHSVLRVLSPEGKTLGSAFLAAPTGLVVTSTHVIAELVNKTHQIEFAMTTEGDASEYRVTAEYRPEWSSAVDDTDVSMLAVTSSLPDVSRPLSLHDGVPEVGIDVWSYGFPAGVGEHPFPAEGRLIGEAFEPLGRSAAWVVKSTEITEGFSGAPCVALSSGALLGVVIQVTISDKHGRLGATAFVIPASSIAALCPQLEVGLPPAARTLLRISSSAAERSKYEWPLAKFGASVGGEYIVPRVGVAIVTRAKGGMFAAAALEIIDEFSLADALDLYLRSSTRLIAIVVASAGLGKSRLLQYVATSAWESPGSVGLAQPHVPISVAARSLASAPTGDVAERLHYALQLEGNISGADGLNADGLRDLLENSSRRVLILVDALDEVENPRKRLALVEWLCTRARDLRERGHSMILSSRPFTALDDKVSDPRYNGQVMYFSLQPFDEPSVSSFLVRVANGQSELLLEHLRQNQLLSLVSNPLFLTLYTAIFERSRSARDLLSMLSLFLESVRTTWHDGDAVLEPPLPDDDILECAAVAAHRASLGSVEVRQQGAEHWLTATDTAVRAIAEERLTLALDHSWGAAITVAQKSVNFLVRRSGLIWMVGDDLRWTHLLLRDYLVALFQSRRWGGDVERIAQIVRTAIPQVQQRDIALFVFLMTSKPGKTHSLLLALQDSQGVWSEEVLVFVCDAIDRGLMLESGDRTLVFEAMARQALQRQEAWGSCRALFTNEVDMFARLLVYQRIPECREAILRAVKASDTGTLMSEWPNTDRSRTFTPSHLYSGRMATLEPIYQRT